MGRWSAGLFAVALSASVAACGDDATESTPTTASVVGPTDATTAPTTSVSVPPTAPVGPTTTFTLPSTGNAEIDALIEKSRTSDYRVIYDNNTDFGIEIYRSGEQIAVLVGDQTIYRLADGSNVLCDVSSTPFCASMPAGGDSLEVAISSLFGIFGAVLAGGTAVDNPLADVTTVTDSVVADRPARCIETTLEGSAFSACLDAEIGILLSASGTEGTETRSITARLVTVGNIDPSVFTLPAPLSA